MAEDRSWLATVLVQPLADDSSARVQVLVPAGVHLASGLYVTAPKADTPAARWLVCSAETCRAEMMLGETELAAWKQGRVAEVRYRVRLDGPVVAFDLSLMGMTAALDAAGSGQ